MVQRLPEPETTSLHLTASVESCLPWQCAMVFCTSMSFTICNILCQKVKCINYTLSKNPPPFESATCTLHWMLLSSCTSLIEMFIFSMPFYISYLPHLSSHHLFSTPNVLVCFIVLCMEDISYHLTFFLNVLRQVNQNKTQHLLCICTREHLWRHDCVFCLEVAVFSFFF